MSSPRGNLGQREESKAPEGWLASDPPDVGTGTYGDKPPELKWVTILTVAVGMAVLELPVQETPEAAVQALNTRPPMDLVKFERYDGHGPGWVRAGSVMVVGIQVAHEMEEQMD